MKSLELQPLLLNAGQVAHLLGISKRHFYTQVSSGRIGPAAIVFGARKLWRLDELERWKNANCPTREKWQAEHINNI